jgi:hypothetical protein
VRPLLHPGDISVGSIWANSANDVWFAMGPNAFRHWDGTSLTVDAFAAAGVLPVEGDLSVLTLTGSPAGGMWAVGGAGATAHRAPSAPTH